MSNEDRPTFLNLPSEILGIVLELLDVHDVLNVRQVCSTFSKLTYERIIWIQLLYSQSECLPLPLDLRRSLVGNGEPLLDGHSTSDIENAVRSTRRRADLWSRPRKSVSRKFKRSEGSGSLLGLDVISARWLVVIYLDAHIMIYDLHPTSAVKGSKLRELNATLHSDIPWSSYAVDTDPEGTTLTIAVAAILVIYVFEIELCGDSNASESAPENVAPTLTIPAPSVTSIRALCLPKQIIAISRSNLIEIISIAERLPDDEVCKATIRVHPENLEDMWNGIIAAEILGPYVLVFKARSLEVHKYDTLLASPNPASLPASAPLKQTFSMTFRDVSFSEISVITNNTSRTKTYAKSLFANDVIQGLYHYIVRLSIHETSELPPSLDVQLLGVYPLATLLHHHNLFSNGSMQANHSSSNLHTTHPPVTHLHEIDDSPTPTYTHTHFTSSFPGVAGGGPSGHVLRGHGPMSNPSARGFVSAHCMGAEGKRAVWVERQRSSTSREVLIWSRERHTQDAFDDGLNGVSVPMAVEIPKKTVFTIQSYDLRDDIIHCAFSEVYGTIALGHRSGEISILNL